VDREWGGEEWVDGENEKVWGVAVESTGVSE
jgi:hypothetical protein